MATHHVRIPDEKNKAQNGVWRLVCVQTTEVFECSDLAKLMRLMVDRLNNGHQCTLWRRKIREEPTELRLAREQRVA